MSLSSQETAHGAKLIPRPSSRCPASAHPVLSPSSQPDTPTRFLAPRPITASPKSSEQLPAGGQALPWTGPPSPQAGQRPAGARAVAEGQAGAPGEGACSPGTPSLTCPAQAGTSGTQVAGEAPGTCGGGGARDMTSHLLPSLLSTAMSHALFHPARSVHLRKGTQRGRTQTQICLPPSQHSLTIFIAREGPGDCLLPECGPQSSSISPS